ncbi:unnamed protein product [Hyaloperonospora brassicae]|uniref:Uncharacterized protein n=1 Tax=Hyaloperonospora brassicae TaxID=162125 RepID=A0AAV0TX42_HYABA|nr:unnamed protein product [Hyaloperonospora brassicae]
MATSPRSILSWLRRCRRDELPVERTLTAIRSVHGLVPLGGRVGGTDGATPPTTPQSAAFSLFSTSQDATCAADVERDEPIEAVRWELLLASVRLPSSGGLRELEHALETLSKLTLSTQAQHSTVDTDRLRQAYFAARREFFTVRIELLRTARNVQHPNAQAAREIVNELLTEGLGDALVDEMLGRQFYQAPSFRRVGKDERKALVAWEVQFLQEEALLRELLLLTLEFSEVHATLERAVAIAKTVHVWDVQVLDELIMNSTLELPGAQQAVETLTQVGVLVALRMLHTTVAGLEHEALLNASKTFFLTNLCGLSGVELRPSPVPGVLLLAWATLLGRQYHVKVGLDGDSAEVKELRDALQQTLASAERLRSFHYLNSLMRSLVFGIDSANAGLARLKPLLQPLSPYAKALWILPTDAVSAGPNGVNATHSDVLVNCDSAPVYQYVVAVFLNEMLSSLGYIKNLDDAQQLHAMVKFVLPALSNTRVSQQIFDIELEDSFPCIQLFTALCCNYQGASSPTVLRQVLRYFSMPHAGKDETVAAGDGWHPLPPREYYTEIGDGQDTLLCTRSFAYGGANGPSVVPAQTVGTILRYGDVVKVTWQFSDGDGDTYAPTMWDLLFQSADRLMTGHESRSFADLYHTNVEDVHILTSFFEFIVQLGNQEDNGEVVVEEMERCWAMDGKSGCWNNLSSTGVHEHRSMLSSGTERGDSHVLLRHIGEFGSDVINMVQLESLVTTCLRFVTLLISNRRNVVDLEAARKILLIPIAYGGMKERKELTVVTLCGEYLGYPLELAPGIAYWSLRILQHAAVAVDFRQERESRNPSVMQSLVSLFHGCEDLDIVRGAFAQLLSVSPTQRFALQKEVIHMLALCLKHQPGFLALLLFGVSSTNDPKSDKMKNEKAKGDDVSCMLLLERLFEDPVRLLEQASDLFCTLLAFVVQVWKGAVHNRFGIHMRIMTTLRANPSFWLNVTQAIKIHMPSDTEEERGLLDMELAAATSLGGGDTHSLSSSSEVYIGRSSAFGYMARGLILQLVSYEWHNEASELKDHPLVDVLESFREEGLYSHWLRTFTRLDYSPVQLKLYAPSIQRACNPRAPITSMHGMIPVDGVFMYLEGLICSNRQLEWQFGHGACAKQEASSADIRMLKLLRWSNLQAAYLHAQLFSLSKWKVFMELCCFQVDEETRGVSGLELTSRTTEPRCRKRKESMISSPSRNSGSRRMQSAGATSTAFLTPSSSEHSLSSSRFSGDRTSFEMIRVLADVIEASVDQHGNQGEVLDYFVLLHLHGLVQLLVSMLHHQLCLVVRKTYDPKLSQTRQRFEGSEPHFGLKLDARATLQLLSLVDKTVSAVHDSVKRVAREADIVGHDAINQSMSTSVELATSVPLISRLVTDFEQSLKSVTDGLLTLLVTAALLLVRHLNKISGHLSHSAKRETEAKGVLTTKALVPMKWIAHCVNVFTLCNDREEQTRSSQALFQLSWCLWQEVVDNYGNSNAPLVGVSEPRMMNVMQLNPFVMDMEYEQQGIRAVLHLLVQRFRPLSPSKQVSASQEDACQVLRGLAAVVWNPANSARPSFCLRLISLLTAQLLPLLRSRMEREEATSKLRGYILQKSDDVMTGQLEDNIHLQRSVAHEMWCLVLDIVSGLLHLHAEYTVVGSDKLDVWEFMSSAESLLLAAVEPSTCPRLTRATIAEHQSLLQLLSGLSRSASTRKCWRQAFPTSAVVLMEQSRQLLRHACVLLGSSSTKDNRYYSEKVEWQNGSRSANNAIVSYGKNRSSKSPRSPRSPSAFPYACETLLHEQLHAVRDVEKREVRAFHREMETELVKVVRFASLLLSKWTASPTDRGAVLVVGGVRCVDEEQLVPLLAFAPPSEARSRNGSPSLGHLSLAMDFILDRLLAKEDPQLGLQTVEMRMGLANAMNACALLFLKTCCLYAEQYELVKRDRDEFSSFFRRFHARIHEDETGATSAVDMQLLQHIDLVRIQMDALDCV